MVEKFARLHNDQFDNDLHFVYWRVTKTNHYVMRNFTQDSNGVNSFVVNSAYLVGNLAEIPHRLQNPLGNCWSWFGVCQTPLCVVKSSWLSKNVVSFFLSKKQIDCYVPSFLEEEVTRSYNNFAYQRASTTAVVEMSGWFSVPSSIPGWVFLGNEIGLGPKRKNTQLKEITRITQLFSLCLQGFLSSFQRPRIFDLLTILIM